MFQHLLNDKKRPQPKIDLTASNHGRRSAHRQDIHGTATHHALHEAFHLRLDLCHLVEGRIQLVESTPTLKNISVESNWIISETPRELKKSTLKPLTVVITTS